MKDLYELLNDVDIDEKDFVEMEVTETERQKVKTSLKKSIRQRRKGRSWKNIAAAAALAGLSVITIGLAFPAYAANIPVVGDIFRFLEGTTGIYDKYKENSTEVALSKESHGIEVALNDAIFDGKTVAITYTIESEYDLGDEHELEKEPFVQPFLLIKGEQGWTGFSRLSKVDENHYVGITTATTNEFIEKKNISVELLMPSIMTKNKQREIKGDWKFDLDLEATENNVQMVNQYSEQGGLKVEVDKITVTPMSFIVYYNQLVSKEALSNWPNADVDIDIKDELGNLYHGEMYGGWSDEEKEVHGFSKTYGELDPKATKLIITPKIRLYKDIAEDGSYIGEETFTLNEITVDLKK
jgi:hypothetical protein